MRGAQGRNRTTDTRIFSRQCDRFFIRINELKTRKQSMLRSVLKNIDQGTLIPFINYLFTCHDKLIIRCIDLIGVDTRFAHTFDVCFGPFQMRSFRVVEYIY